MIPERPDAQAEEAQEAVSLGELLQDQTANPVPAEVIIETEAVPARKRKAKPKPRLRLPLWAAASLLSLLVGFILAAVMFIAPATVTLVQRVDPPIDNGMAVKPVMSVDQMLDRWMRTNRAIGAVPAETDVRVLSADDQAGYYNVADMQGNLTIAHESELYAPDNPPSPDLYPPAGPYAYALGRTEKLLVTTEWNNGLPPGTAVRCMGLRVEDGLWVYEVSPDGQHVYFLPWIHLAPIRVAEQHDQAPNTPERSISLPPSAAEVKRSPGL
jgi:hypothetical protein